MHLQELKMFKFFQYVVKYIILRNYTILSSNTKLFLSNLSSCNDEIIGIWAGIGDVFDSIENYLMYGRFMFSNLIKVYKKNFYILVKTTVALWIRVGTV